MNMIRFDKPHRPVNPSESLSGVLRENIAEGERQESHAALCEMFSTVHADIAVRLSAISACLGACENYVSDGQVNAKAGEGLQKLFAVAQEELALASGVIKSARRLSQRNQIRPTGVLSVRQIVEDLIQVHQPRWSLVNAKIELAPEAPRVYVDADLLQRPCLIIFNFFTQLWAKFPQRSPVVKVVIAGGTNTLDVLFRFTADREREDGLAREIDEFTTELVNEFKVLKDTLSDSSAITLSAADHGWSQITLSVFTRSQSPQKRSPKCSPLF